MKTSFKKTLIAASAGAAMLAAVGSASANSLLFPYFTTTTGAQSVLSLSNTGTAATQAIHYVYNYGSTCTHFDAVGSLTGNDILSHSIASTAAGGFGKVVGTDTSVPVYFPLANQNGFLVVSSKTLPDASALRGSMAIADPTTGLVVSYRGIDNGLLTNGANGANGEGNFSIADVNFPLTTLPNGVVTTSWYAVIVGDMGPSIAAGANWDAKATFTNNGNIFDNDEHPFSGTQTKPITCSGLIVATDLMTGAQAAAVGPNGGLIKTTAGALVAPTTLGGTTTGVVLMKMQKVLPVVGAPFGNLMFQHREQAGL